MTTKTLKYSMSWDKELTLTKKDCWKLCKVFFKSFIATLKVEDLLNLL